MKQQFHALTCMLVCVQMAFSQLAQAQCSPPSAFWLSTTPSSTTIPLNWTPVSGATHYKVRFWDQSLPADKTVFNHSNFSSLQLTGLKKDTKYSVQVRAVCSSSSAPWSIAQTYVTAKSTEVCSGPTGMVLVPQFQALKVTWTSSGSHTVRYRQGNTGDWTIPNGALDVQGQEYLIFGLANGTYEVELKKNCAQSTSVYLQATAQVQDICPAPAAPVVMADYTFAKVVLPAVSGVLGYHVDYRLGNSGAWIRAASNVPASEFVLNPPLLTASAYQVQVQAVCASGLSNFSAPTNFTTLVAGACLANPEFGKNLDQATIKQIDNQLNYPSQFTFGTMIGVNDGGLFNRAFQNSSANPLTELCTQYRAFHPMDEDFNTGLINYQSNRKPKDTQPEGTPANIGYNRFLYNIYKNTHGFSSIVAATELLQYDGLSWKDKFYKESDWSQSGPQGIRNSFENYVKTFIDANAPANGAPNQILISHLQIGNELWDYPIKSDYHDLLTGAHNAFLQRYGQKSDGGWKMKLVAGSFQAFRESNCSAVLRDVSNCGPNLERHDFIGDYLAMSNCEVLRDLDAIDCHPYSFLPRTLSWTYPENPVSEGWQIRNLAAWKNANQNSSTGVLVNTRLWASEYGFDSNPTTGVGEKTQSAYLIRGLLLHSRYHFEKVYFYNGFDHSRAQDPYYHGLYNSSGFWKLGTNPASGVASPLPAHGATPKPAWYGMLDFKGRFGNHVFFKALVENEEVFVFLLAKPDGTDPYLLFWSPSPTNDQNINSDIPVNIPVNWSGILPSEYGISGATAQTFASSTLAAEAFVATGSTGCGTTVLTNIRRSPAFIKLTGCSACPNVTDPGAISATTSTSNTGSYNPGLIVSLSAASGGDDDLEYKWQQSTNNIDYTDIPAATSLSYDPPVVTQTTYFRRAAKRYACPDFQFTQPVAFVVIFGCPRIVSFERVAHTNPGCNSAGDYYYEIKMEDVQKDEQILISGLPGNGINIGLSSLNGQAFTTGSFFNNVQYVNSNSSRWVVSPNNGSSQSLRLYFCWANQYAEPVSATTAASSCAGTVFPCSVGQNRPDDRTEGGSLPGDAGRIKAHPNPGSDYFWLMSDNETQPGEGRFRVLSLNGATVLSQDVSGDGQENGWRVDASRLPAGMYVVFVQTATNNHVVRWEKLN